MADFSALKTAIQTYIKQNGNEEITGEILQKILLSVVTTLGDSAINNLVTALADEVAARQNADGTLQQNINDEVRNRANADGTLQGAINGITAMIENGYVYAGIATPSTTPATGKVFYLALTAGTYTNFGSIEVSQGINILKYNGSAWSLDAFIGIDDTPTPNSPKLVKSGGAFDSVMANGSAFDISAHFASGGTLATYADLSAALNALDTLSASYKRGGMSIKFVQSSDNKYAQYRLMSDTFSTAVANWQGVDDVPTVGSKNLVESGAVYEIEKTSAGIDIVIKEDDLLIADKNGNYIASFIRGNIKTKKFDSSKVSEEAISDFSEDGDFNLIDEQLYSILRLYDGHIRTKKFDSKSICDIINNNITYLSTVISKYDNKVAHCGTLDFDDFGNWYSAYYKDDETTHETPTNLSTKAMIAYGNLADPSKVTRLEVIGAEQTIGNYTQGSRAPYDPNFKIFNGVGRCYFNGYVDEKVVIAYRNFDISTKELENNAYVALLKYSVSGTEKTVDFNSSNLYTMLSELGISATFYNDLVLSSRFVNYNNYWYVTLSGAFCIDLKPVILRTQDGITFEYVTYCSSFSAGSVESSLEIVDDYIIVSQRGTTKCEIGKFDFNGNTIVSPKTISNNLSKTALILFNNKLICAFNVYPNITTEWGVVFRSHLRLAIIDTTTLSVKNYTDITNDAGIHYPFLNKYKGSLYMVFTEDRKKLNIGETRSNISLTKLIN